VSKADRKLVLLVPLPELAGAIQRLPQTDHGDRKRCQSRGPKKPKNEKGKRKRWQDPIRLDR
jgi:hypothetical protein